MRRIVIWLASTVTVVVLLFGYHTSTNSAAGSSTSSASAPATAGAASTPASPASSAPSTPSASSTSTTYTGAVAQTRWGPVQVQISVSDKKVTAVDVVEYPQNNPKDQQINAYALPILVQDTLEAQSAKIDAVSGATVTSDGYVSSLQSALDQAGI